MSKITEQLVRLYIQPGQQVHIYKDGDYFPDGGLSPGRLEQHLIGNETLALNLVSSSSLVKAMVIDFDGAAHGNATRDWNLLTKLHTAVQTELGLPAPAISLSGRKGYGLWFSLEEAIPAIQAQQFLRGLRAKYLASIPKDEIDLRPDTDKPTKAALAVAKLPPCVHPGSGLWSAFINPLLDGQSDTPPVGLEHAPDLEKQAALLEGLQPIKAGAFLHALTRVQTGLGGPTSAQNEPTHVPLLDRLKNGSYAPCIDVLLKDGCPSEMQYNTANINLAAYCHTAGFIPEETNELARRMAEASEGHPTTKDLNGKLKNFHSNAPATFYCEYARNTPGWRDKFNCANCAANPGFTTDKQTSQTQNNALVLEETVALELLAYAWHKGEALPQITKVWPVRHVEIADSRKALPVYELAAQALHQGATSAAYFGILDKYISEKHLNAFTAKLKQEAEGFITKLQATSVSDVKGKAALDRALKLEKRAALTDAALDVLKLGAEVAPNLMAMQLRAAAESTLKSESVAGPLSSYRDTLFSNYAKAQDSLVPTPFPRLNGLLHGGLRGGRLYTVIAPPKAGKTTFATQCLDHAAANGVPSLYVGYEMAREQLVDYAIARKIGINSRKLEERDLTVQEAEAVASALEEYLAVEGQFLEIWEAGLATTMADVAAWITRAKAQHPDATPLVVIDYLQLARTGIKDVDNSPSETKRVSEVAVACKDLARQTGAAVMALSSVTKEAERASREEGEIDVTAARDSLAIIHASDGVLTLQTQSLYVKEGKGEDKVTTQVDPWGYLAYQAREQGREQEAANLERALQKMQDYPAFHAPSFATRARLSLVRHRGSTGEVPLYYRRAYHQFEGVTLPGYEASVSNGDNSVNTKDVFLKYANTKAESVAPTALDLVVTAMAQSAPAEAVKIECHYITTLEEAEAAIAGLTGVLGLDLETTGLVPVEHQARLLSLSDGTTSLVIDLFAIGGLRKLKEALEGLQCIAHNATFDMGFLWQAGIALNMDCTMLAYHVLTGKRAKLKDLASEYLGVELDKGLQVSDWSAADLTPEQINYAALDAQVLPELFAKLQAEIAERDSQAAYAAVKDAQPAIVNIKLNGMPFNLEGQKELIANLTQRRDFYRQQLINALNGRSPSSTQQLGDWLTEELGGANSDKYKAWPKTPAGKLKTGNDDLQRGLVYLGEEAAKLVRDLLLPYKEVEKKLSAFGDSLAAHVNPITGRIHADYSLAGTVTGRMSCSKPNLQQIPRDKDYRALFAPPAGSVFVVADYGAMELRVAAQLAGEEKLIEAFRTGIDPHKQTAAMILEKDITTITKAERQLAKAVNFGLLYGQGAKGLQSYAAASYGVEITEEQARIYRNAWFHAYPAFKAWHTKGGLQARKALAVRTPLGRERRWATADDFKETEAYNTPVQGGAAEVMLIALGLMYRDSVLLANREAIKLVAVVHDEVIFEVLDEHNPDSLASAVMGKMINCMEEAMALVFQGAPTKALVEAAIGNSWADK